MHTTASLRDAFFAALKPKPDPGALCRQIVRQVAAHPGRWYACRSRACRRHRRCASHSLDCAAHVLTREQQTSMLAQLQHALKEDGK